MWSHGRDSLLFTVVARAPQELVEDEDSLVFVLIDEVESLTAARTAAVSGSEPSDAIRCAVTLRIVTSHSLRCTLTCGGIGFPLTPLEDFFAFPAPRRSQNGAGCRGMDDVRRPGW